MKNRGGMKAARRVLRFGVLSLLVALPAARAKEPKATGWGYARAGPVEVRASPSSKGRVLARLGRGSVLGLYGTETRAGTKWCHVQGVNLKEVSSTLGWVDCAAVETLPLGRLPDDDALLTQAGGAFLEDTAKPHIVIARFLAGTGGTAPALVCVLASPFLPQARLQVFETAPPSSRDAGLRRAGAFLEFPFSEHEPGITTLEIRDLLGDGNECVITHEPINFGRGETGVKLVIRRIDGSRFKKLWEAPLELTNLASYPPHPEVLQPPERNIGAPGTVTKGEVTFRPACAGRLQGQAYVPVWAGTVEIHVVGRERPIQTIQVEKACPWKGAQFTPLIERGKCE